MTLQLDESILQQTIEMVHAEYDPDVTAKSIRATVEDCLKLGKDYHPPGDTSSFIWYCYRRLAGWIPDLPPPKKKMIRYKKGACLKN